MNKKFVHNIILTLVLIMVTFCAHGCKKEAKENQITENTISETAGITESDPTVESGTTVNETMETTEDATIETEEVLIVEGGDGTVVETINPEEMEIIEMPEDPAIEGETSYEQYNAMTGTEQAEFMETFESVEAFFEWYNTAKAEYENARNDIEITGNEIIEVVK